MLSDSWPRANTSARAHTTPRTGFISYKLLGASLCSSLSFLTLLDANTLSKMQIEEEEMMSKNI